MSMRTPTRAKLLGASALGLIGCNGSDPCDGLRTFDAPPEPEASPTAAPKVLAGEWIGAGVLELQFSKPLAEGTTPDPQRFAVIGWAAQVQSYDYAGADTCYVRTRYAPIGTGYYGFTSVADVWVAPEDPSILRLRMASAGADCRTIADTVEQGVMLAYTDAPAGDQPLRDSEGNPIPDIGPAWSITGLDNCLGYGNYYYYGCYSLNNTAVDHLPALTELAMIPCPGDV